MSEVSLAVVKDVELGVAVCGRLLICTAARWNPVMCGTDQGSEKRRFDATLRAGAGRRGGAAALRVGPHRLFQVVDFQCRSPESGDLWCESRHLKDTI